MYEFLWGVSGAMIGCAIGYTLGSTRAKSLLKETRELATSTFRRQLNLLRSACTGSAGALQLATALDEATEGGKVSLEALRRDIALAVEKEQAAVRDPWIRCTTDALLAVHQASACLDVVDCADQRDRLLVQDAQEALGRARLALVPRGTAQVATATA